MNQLEIRIGDFLKRKQAKLENVRYKGRLSTKRWDSYEVY